MVNIGGCEDNIKVVENTSMTENISIVDESDFFRKMADSAENMMFLINDKGLILYANESSRALLEYDNLTGVCIDIIFPGFFGVEENFAAAVRMKEKQFAADGKMSDTDAYRMNRTCFPVRAKIMPYSADKWFFIAYDISEQVLYQKKLLKADEEVLYAKKVKDEFVANMTHELRTPVNGILGSVRALMDMTDSHKEQKIFANIEHACSDMNALINNILDFSKLNAGGIILEKRPFEVRKMIEYVRGNHINKTMEKGLDFVINIGPMVPDVIVGDELRITQILNNLLSNACKFTNVGRINLEVVRTKQVDNRVELFFMVIDSGIGIAKEDIDKLFRSFSQVDASIARRYGGTGLGLNISKQLVELMDGHIQVDSEKNKGSMFSFNIWVELPQNTDTSVQMTTQMTDKTSTSMVALTAADHCSSESKSYMVNAAEYEKKPYIHTENEAGVTYASSGDMSAKDFGSAENLKELDRKISKLILSVELENWEKAEMFSESVRELTFDAPREVKSQILRLKMAVQKEDVQKAEDTYDVLCDVLQKMFGKIDVSGLSQQVVSLTGNKKGEGHGE